MPDDFGGRGKPEHFDVLIVGAGISGIGAAVHLQDKCPNKRYAILEARENLGGTWDLFRYPGIRSDSDMYTLGFSFRPWNGGKAIADGPSILQYLKDTAAEYGVDRKIRYRQRVVKTSWSSEDVCWTVEVQEGEEGKTKVYTCNFLFACSGYYRYDQGYTPEFPGRENFKGQVVHPQLWTDDIVYEGKKVVIIGSGATAVTLVPELAKKAEMVTMLQRSPTYMISAPWEDKLHKLLDRYLPEDVAYGITRWKNVGMQAALYHASRRFPDKMKDFFIEGVRRQLPKGYDVEKHFTPYYKPWDQRLCLVPKGDLFKAIRKGKAQVVTDHIETFTEKGIKLKSGQELEADLIVTATGLQVQLFGGASLFVDGKEMQPADTMAYKAMMVGDVPNFAFAVGYTNASWTLKVDLVANYVCRLLNHMDAKGYTMCTPKYDPKVERAPLLDFDAGYIKRALKDLPEGGARYPWRVFENYALDRAALNHAPLADGIMKFKRRVPARARAS
jgi:cation diffusion facilitator CzcD-associated flavoprotein CzcO